MKRTLIISLAGVAGLVASCTFGPIWSSPEMPVPAEFRGAGAAGSTMADLAWQQVLNDKNLQELLNDVFANNRSLEAMMHNVEAARRYITVARAANKFTAVFEKEEATAVGAVVAQDKKKEIYDLAGRRVSKAKNKGLYVVNGKKTLVR